MRQAEALRKRSANEIDWDNVAEEIESLGKSFANELRNRYAVLLAHLLKWMFQPERRSNSWRATIITQRGEIRDHLEEHPGLKPQREALFAKSYRQARGWAASETDLPLEDFPAGNPFSLEQAMDEAFWPEAKAE
jgi:hypothetical protein